MTDQTADTHHSGAGVLALSPERFGAVLFDLDGVVTDTARVHLAAWTTAFNDFLRERGGGKGVAPFTPDDYRRFVDGRPRLDGVRDFLAARGISLPEGKPDDTPDQRTVHALAARKNALFLDEVTRHGVVVYESTVALIETLREAGVKTALVTASRNREAVVRAAGLEWAFDAFVDGNDRKTLGLHGKPAPDSYLEAARRVGVPPERAVVVEDASAGVAAGRAGEFGLVVGVDRTGHADELRASGADVVVPDLSWVVVATATVGGGADPWLLAFDGFDPALEGRRETLFALGNGYFVTRGATAESHADQVHYPGTYLAGGYNRLVSTIDGRSVEHEDLVNLPNWLPLTFRIDDDPWFGLHAVELLEYHQELDLRAAVYERRVRMRDAKGRETRIVERRVVHMHERHLAAQSATITALNWSGRLTIRALLDGAVANGGVARYRAFDGNHLRIRNVAAPDPETVMLEAETTQSRLGITLAARIRVGSSEPADRITRRPLLESTSVGQEFSVSLGEGGSMDVEKVVALFTSRDRAIADGASEARIAVSRARSFDELLVSQRTAWRQLWDRCDVKTVETGPDGSHHTHLVVRLHVFHLLQTASHNTMELDVGIPARGWHGEAYRGHVFWDELFIFPFLGTRMPTLARALLLYRYRRLPEARWAARSAGYRGAMFPWQSGSNGREETDVMYFNPRSGRWMRDDTHLQRHAGAAIAYNVWQHYQATEDAEFLLVYGAELLVEIGRFWASVATWNAARGRYDIRGVLGPDEFHDRYPGADEPGLTNNAYTNVMASWCLARARDVLELLPMERRRELCRTLHVTSAELERWDDVSRKLYLPFLDDGILAQFEGYESLAEFDWEAYRHRYADIRRLDLILEAEGDSTNRYKLSKQADVLMLFYVFTAEELAEMFARLGYAFEGEMIPRTIDYYLHRTSHGSTLSGIVHAWVLARSSRSTSWPLFLEALRSDIEDIQGGTTAEGIHLGAVAGTLDLLQRCYTGLEMRSGELRFHPVLPDEVKRLSFRLRYRRHTLSFEVTASMLDVSSAPSPAESITIVVDGHPVVVQPGTKRSIPLARAPSPQPASPAAERR